MPTDSLGCLYDRTWINYDGVRYFWRDSALGRAAGPAQWSEEHDCNPICGCHLSAKCLSCNVCLTCDGCYCNDEGDY